jgi:hypothetical protein
MYTPRKEKISQLLSLFAKEKEIYQSELEGKTGVSYRNIITQLQILEQNGLIGSPKVERRPERGRGKYIWTITLNGLLNYLHSTINTITKEELDIIATNHADLLPLIFGKWKFFKQNNLDDLVILRLMREAAKTPLAMHNLMVAPKFPAGYSETDEYKKEVKEWKSAHREIKEAVGANCEDLTTYILLRPTSSGFTFERTYFAEELKTYYKALKKEPEIREFADLVLEREKAELERKLEEARKVTEFWQNLPS